MLCLEYFGHFGDAGTVFDACYININEPTFT